MKDIKCFKCSASVAKNYIKKISPFTISGRLGETPMVIPEAGCHFSSVGMTVATQADSPGQKRKYHQAEKADPTFYLFAGKRLPIKVDLHC